MINRGLDCNLNLVKQCLIVLLKQISQKYSQHICLWYIQGMKNNVKIFIAWFLRSLQKFTAYIFFFLFN